MGALIKQGPSSRLSHECLLAHVNLQMEEEIPSFDLNSPVTREIMSGVSYLWNVEDFKSPFLFQGQEMVCMRRSHFSLFPKGFNKSLRGNCGLCEIPVPRI